MKQLENEWEAKQIARPWSRNQTVDCYNSLPNLNFKQTAKKKIMKR